MPVDSVSTLSLPLVGFCFPVFECCTSCFSLAALAHFAHRLQLASDELVLALCSSVSISADRFACGVLSFSIGPGHVSKVRTSITLTLGIFHWCHWPLWVAVEIGS